MTPPKVFFVPTKERHPLEHLKINAPDYISFVENMISQTKWFTTWSTAVFEIRLPYICSWHVPPGRNRQSVNWLRTNLDREERGCYFFFAYVTGLVDGESIMRVTTLLRQICAALSPDWPHANKQASAVLPRWPQIATSVISVEIKRSLFLQDT